MRKQKILIAALIAINFTTGGCGKAATSGNFNSENEGANGASACYLGEKSQGEACIKVKTIDPKKEKYLNPFTDSSFMSGANKEQYRMPVQGVDLAASPQSLRIAPNFVISEFMSIQKGSFGIFSTYVVKKIQELRSKTGSALRINSAFRSPKWNASISGSAKWSRHQYGDAVDIASSTATLNQLVQYCRELGATYIDKYVSHVHCDWRNKPVEPIFFGALDSKHIHQLSNEEARFNIVSNLKETSFIQVSGNLKAGNIILLKSHVTYTEDSEELYKRWEIAAPNGDLVTLEQSEVSLPVQKGTYQVLHTIGENIKLTKTLVIQ